MKIITRDEFMKLGEDVLYSKYEPYIFEELLIKKKSIPNDWFYLEIKSAVDMQNTNHILSAGQSIDMDFDIMSRDGCYDKEQLFAIYEKKEIQKIITKLQKCL